MHIFGKKINFRFILNESFIYTNNKFQVSEKYLTPFPNLQIFSCSCIVAFHSLNSGGRGVTQSRYIEQLFAPRLIIF